MSDQEDNAKVDRCERNGWQGAHKVVQNLKMGTTKKKANETRTTLID